jgi:hypothetical protein
VRFVITLMSNRRHRRIDAMRCGDYSNVAARPPTRRHAVATEVDDPRRNGVPWLSVMDPAGLGDAHMQYPEDDDGKARDAQ